MYAVILGFPVSGILLSLSQDGGQIDVYGWIVSSRDAVASDNAALWRFMHDQILPWTFYFAIAMHLAAVLKHHFVTRRVTDVRRMLR